ncbi:MAG: DUF2207 domain-containing protein [Chitinophagales bacterium]
MAAPPSIYFRHFPRPATLFAVCVVLFFFRITASAQSYVYTKISQHYLSDNDVDSAIYNGAKDMALGRGFPIHNFEQNYEANKAELMELVAPNAYKNFQWIDSGASDIAPPGTISFENRRSSYQKELSRAVRDAFYEHPEFSEKIFSLSEDDRILSFYSDVVIEKNGLLQVVETIKIYNGAGGDNDLIHHGILRDFPTHYQSKYGLITTVPFKVVSVTRNGEPEPFVQKKMINGMRLMIGNATSDLEQGEHTYQITYTTSRQIIFHNNKDELYWNVNGNGWNFRTEIVKCRFTFPEGAKIEENNCYTGVQNASGHQCRVKILGDNMVEFSTTTPLNIFEGLTVSTIIGKGAITPPSGFQNLMAFIGDNPLLTWLSLLVLLLFSVNFYFWRKIGRDPKGGTIIPQFEPPKDFSPADCGYLMNQEYTNNLFTATIVDFAVNHQLDIQVMEIESSGDSSKQYYFGEPHEKKANEARDELRYKWYGFDASELYGHYASKLKYNAVIAEKYRNLEYRLESRILEKKDEKTSSGYLALNNKYTGLGFILLFIAALAGMIYVHVSYYTFPLIVTVVILIAGGVLIQYFFGKWMSAYTQEGRKIMDHILGFKMYLETAEQRKFDQLNPPEMTIQLFEKYLPYAIALGCENQWAKKFENVISEAISKGYQPAYYHQNGMNFSTANFSESFSGNLSSVIASASTPPSSSGGGGGGGGFSGGGGGGGGGGGW